MILSLCFAETPSEDYIQLRGSQKRKDINLWGWFRENCEDDQRLQHRPYEDRLRARSVQPEEEKAPGKPYCSFSVLKGGL